MPRFVLLILLLLSISVESSARNDDGIRRIKQALQSGRPAVIAITDTIPRHDSETYADWAAYLNEFAASNTNLVVVAMEARDFRRAFEAKPPLNHKHATIFARAPGHAIVYLGTILESFVYQSGLHYLLRPEDGFDKQLFEPIELQLSSAKAPPRRQ